MPDRPSLTTLMRRYGTDKLHGHHYDEEYARHFDPIRDRPIKLLEIGIGGYNVPKRGGESLKTWAEYFPNGQITGLDIENKSFLNTGRIMTWKGSQTDVEFLRRLSDVDGPFDIVIDDGSHRQDHVLITFHALFPLLRSGGIYVIEDMETAYRLDYGGNPTPLRWPLESPDQATAIDLIGVLVDGLHWHFWRGGRTPTEIQRMVKSVHVSKELAFIYKR